MRMPERHADRGVRKRGRISFESTYLIGSSEDDGNFTDNVKDPTRNYGVWGTPDNPTTPIRMHSWMRAYLSLKLTSTDI
jgi:hypothetical protein